MNSSIFDISYYFMLNRSFYIFGRVYYQLNEHMFKIELV